MVGTLNLSDSSVDVWRGSEADLESSTFSVYTFESDCSPKRIKVSPIKKKPDVKVTFMLQDDQETETEDEYYEEPYTNCSPCSDAERRDQYVCTNGTAFEPNEEIERSPRTHDWANWRRLRCQSKQPNNELWRRRSRNPLYVKNDHVRQKTTETDCKRSSSMQ